MRALPTATILSRSGNTAVRAVEASTRRRPVRLLGSMDLPIGPPPVGLLDCPELTPHHNVSTWGSRGARADARAQVSAPNKPATRLHARLRRMGRLTTMWRR